MFLMPENKWARLSAFVTGLVNQKLLLQNEYLAAENRILRAHLPARMCLSDPERSTVGIVNVELNENMEFARPSSIPLAGAQCASRGRRRNIGGL